MVARWCCLVPSWSLRSEVTKTEALGSQTLVRVRFPLLFVPQEGVRRGDLGQSQDQEKNFFFFRFYVFLLLCLERVVEGNLFGVVLHLVNPRVGP